MSTSTRTRRRHHDASHRTGGARLVLAGLLAAAAGQLLLRHGVGQLQLAVRAPVPDLGDLLTALASAAAGALLLWVLITAITSAMVLLLRSRGRRWSALEAVERRLAPALVRRAVAAGLGVSAVVGLAAPSALAAVPSGQVQAQVVPVSSPGVGAQAGPVPLWPAEAAAPPEAAPPAPTPATSSTTTATPTTATPSAAAPTPTTPTGSDRVVVGAGDSLWSLAQEHLGPHPTDRAVAQEWPRWWAANRAVVGDDPDLLQPGQVLRVPGSAR